MERISQEKKREKKQAELLLGWMSIVEEEEEGKGKGESMSKQNGGLLLCPVKQQYQKCLNFLIGSELKLHTPPSRLT